jgi:hypothetical protein
MALMTKRKPPRCSDFSQKSSRAPIRGHYRATPCWTQSRKARMIWFSRHATSKLRLKWLAPDGPSLEFDVEIFVCAKCGHEQSHRLSHDPYAARTASNTPPAKVG